MRRMNRFLYIILFAISILFVIFIFLTKSEKSHIKIGLMVTLTGKSPELGREIRDGAFLAVEEINKRGGIKGRHLSLVIKDNKGNPETAKQNFLELLNEDIVAIIGPSTSTVAKAVIPLANENKILLISPNVAASEFSGIDDYFITLEPSNYKSTKKLASYIKEKIKPKKIIIIHDEKNPVYTRDFTVNFVLNFEKNTSILTIPFKDELTDFDILVKEVIRLKPDLILLVTDVFSASIITQKIKKNYADAKIAVSTWARFHGFLDNTGYISDGVLSVGIYDLSKPNEYYLNFQRKFMDIFGYIPDSPAINGYQAIFIIYEALLKGAKRDNLKDIIISKGKFNGFFGEFFIDRYGDVLIEPIVVMAKNGVFEKVKE